MEVTPDMKQAMIDHLKKRLYDDLYEMRVLNETKVALEYDMNEKGMIINKLKTDIKTLEGVDDKNDGSEEYVDDYESDGSLDDMAYDECWYKDHDDG